MSETLVIRLLPSVNPTEHSEITTQWLLADTNGARLGTVLQGRLAEAAGLAEGRKVIVLVPSTQALYLTPVLPTLKSATKLNQIVPYALEDQLASDVDTLHFAIGKHSKLSSTPVIVISRTAMHDWLAALTAVNAIPDALYLDTTLLPCTQDGLTLWIDQGRASIKKPDGSVHTLDMEPLSDALQLLIPATEKTVNGYIAEPEYHAVQHEIDLLRSRVPNLVLKVLPDDALPLLATQAPQTEAINLLQGEYIQRKKNKPNTGSWRIAATLLMGVIGLHLLTKGMELLQLGKQEAALDQQIELVYNRTLPGAAPVKPLQARQAFETRWQQLQEIGKPTHLMASLDVLSRVISNTKDVQVEQLEYQNNSIHLILLAPNSDSLEIIRSQIQSQGVTTELVDSDQKGEKVEGRLSLTPKTGA